MISLIHRVERLENKNRPRPDDPLRIGELTLSEQLAMVIALEQLERDQASPDEQAALSESMAKHEAQLARLPPPNTARLNAVVEHILRTLAARRWSDWASPTALRTESAPISTQAPRTSRSDASNRLR